MSRYFIYLLFFLCCLFLYACKSSEKLLKQTEAKEDEAKYMEALAELEDFYRKKKEFEPAKDNALVDALNRITSKYLDKIYQEAQQRGNNAQTLKDLEETYKLCEDMRLVYNKATKMPILGKKSNITFKTEYDYFTRQTYDHITEEIYKEAKGYLENNQFEKADNRFGDVEKRNNGENGYLDTRQLRQEAYEKQTHLLFEQTDEIYQNALSTRQINELEKAYNGFLNITKRNRYPNLSYVDTFEALKRKDEAYNQITEILFQNAEQSKASNNYQEAYSIYDKILQRNLDQDYRKKVLVLQKECYDAITNQMHNTAIGFYQQKKYRAAYQKLSEVRNRQDAFTVLGNLDSQIQECLNLGKVHFKFQFQTYHPDLENIELQVKRAVQDEFIEFNEDNYQKANLITANYIYEYVSWKGKNTPDRQEGTESVYQIKSEKRGQPEQLFYWTERVNYFHIKGTKQINCKATYRVNLTYWSSSRKPTNTFGETTTTTEQDNLDYYVRNGEYDINRLTRQSLASDQARTERIDPQGAIAQRFQPERLSFENETAMESTVRKAALDKITQKIIEDLRVIAKSIE